MWARRGPNARPVGPDERFANAFVGPQRVGVARRKVPMSRVVVGRVPTSHTATPAANDATREAHARR
jgi:hypothetical protein